MQLQQTLFFPWTRNWEVGVQLIVLIYYKSVHYQTLAGETKQKPPLLGKSSFSLALSTYIEHFQSPVSKRKAAYSKAGSD